VQVVRAVTDRHRARHRDLLLGREPAQPVLLRRPVHDRTGQPPGQPPAGDLQPVGPHPGDALCGGDRIDDLVEPAGDQRHRPVPLVQRGHQLGRPRAELDLRAHLVQHTDLEPGEGGHPFGQRGGEVQLATHRPLGDRRHLGTGPGPVGEQVDLLGGDERGVHVQHHQVAGRLLPLISCPRAHAASTRPFLGTTVTPSAVMVNPRASSCSRSTPTVAPSATTTDLSRMARCTRACRCTSTPSISTDPVTCDQEWIRTSGESTEELTSPPETTTPGEMIESVACPTRSPDRCTNFAGGSPVYPVYSGQSLLYRLNTGSTAIRSWLAS